MHNFSKAFSFILQEALLCTHDTVHVNVHISFQLSLFLCDLYGTARLTHWKGALQPGPAFPRTSLPNWPFRTASCPWHWFADHLFQTRKRREEKGLCGWEASALTEDVRPMKPTNTPGADTQDTAAWGGRGIEWGWHFTHKLQKAGTRWHLKREDWGAETRGAKVPEDWLRWRDEKQPRSRGRALPDQSVPLNTWFPSTTTAKYLGCSSSFHFFWQKQYIIYTLWDAYRKIINIFIFFKWFILIQHLNLAQFCQRLPFPPHPLGCLQTGSRIQCENTGCHQTRLKPLNCWLGMAGHGGALQQEWAQSQSRLHDRHVSKIIKKN